MVRIYLDLETYRPRKEDAFVDEKIICCGLLVDEAPYCEDSLKEKGELILFSEWNELDERAIVAKVHEFVAEMQKGHRFTVICGFNILRFDVPLLICKAVQHSLGKHEVFSKIWNDCFTIDYFQQLLVANDNQFKGLTLENIVKVAKRVNLKPPKYSKPGRAVKDLYEAKKFREIEKHLEQDLRIVRWLDLYGARKLIEISVKEGKALFRE
ncbi:MAG: hypothetical protein QXQ94_08020 [Candidatus Bathyarchaeia archaeon]